jgi:hypothetical protein
VHLPDHHQPFGFGKWQGAEQHHVDDAEDCRIGVGFITLWRAVNRETK